MVPSPPEWGPPKACPSVRMVIADFAMLARLMLRCRHQASGKYRVRVCAEDGRAGRAQRLDDLAGLATVPGGAVESLVPAPCAGMIDIMPQLSGLIACQSSVRMSIQPAEHVAHRQTHTL